MGENFKFNYVGDGNNASLVSAMGLNTEQAIVCYSPTMVANNGVWQGENPLDYSLPLFITQLTIVVLTTRLLVFLLKPFRQPRVISEIIGGVVLGPSVMGLNKKFGTVIFPLRGIMVLETMANVGLLYFLFLIGVEMELSVIKRTGKKAMCIAVAGMIFPLLISICFSYILRPSAKGLGQGTLILFLGVALSVTAFPVLARVLADLKLLNTELGRLAMSAAVINDMCAWILLALAIALSEHSINSLASLWVILSTTGFVLFCIFVFRPAISWIIRRTPEGENFSEFHICLILTGVMFCGFTTDVLGSHAILGAFVYGLIIPSGPLAATLIEKLEDFVSGLLLPLFFAISGLRTNIWAIKGFYSWGYMLLIVILGCTGKVIGTVIVSLFYQMPVRDGVALGLLMNTKGLVEMVVINVGRDQKVLDEQTFAILVIVAVVMTAIISPAITAIYRPTRHFMPHKRRNIQRSKPETELRILSCIHTPRNVPSLINLLDASRPTKRSPIFVYALHLVELTGRTSAMLIVHDTRKSGQPALNRTQAQSDHIIHAFQNYEQHTLGVTVQHLTAISPYSTMHEDICNLADDKRISLIIVPFHKQQTVDGGMESTNPAFRNVNQNVLLNAPCSVGILVDRGLGGSARVAVNHISHRVAVLFFGGPDDREALAYGMRMANHPGISLTVVRFLPGEDVSEVIPAASQSGDRVLELATHSEREKQLDNELISEFRVKNASDETVVYAEKVVNNGEETVAALRSMESVYDLYIVGRGQGIISPLTAGLTDWSECPELGAIGDLLASSDFAAAISVLVVQQYVGYGGDMVGTPDSSQDGEQYGNVFHINPRSVGLDVGGIQQTSVQQQQQRGGGGASNGFASRWNS